MGWVFRFFLISVFFSAMGFFGELSFGKAMDNDFSEAVVSGKKETPIYKLYPVHLFRLANLEYAFEMLSIVRDEKFVFSSCEQVVELNERASMALVGTVEALRTFLAPTNSKGVIFDETVDSHSEPFSSLSHGALYLRCMPWLENQNAYCQKIVQGDYLKACVKNEEKILSPEAKAEVLGYLHYSLFIVDRALRSEKDFATSLGQ